MPGTHAVATAPRTTKRTSTRSAPRAVIRAAEPLEAPTAELALDSLRVGPSLREGGLDAAHVATLTELAGDWPPIVVNRSDHAVIDGQHRVAAARQLGLTHLGAVLFDGSPDDAYVEFVRCNVGHGLPLSLAERRVAARRILGSHPDRSDRSIAGVCGISPKTVARLRDELAVAEPRTNAAATAVQSRIGRDGRVRPLDAVAVRARIAEELTRQPDASLRAIAAVVGASPETVRSVRNKLAATDDAAPAGSRLEPEPEATVLGLLSRKPRVERALRGDCAFTGREGGEDFVAWFDSTCVDQVDCWEHLGAVPLSRIYEVADEARRRATFWLGFAETLEGQIRRRA